jgi:hypothetical protein
MNASLGKPRSCGIGKQEFYENNLNYFKNAPELYLPCCMITPNNELTCPGVGTTGCFAISEWTPPTAVTRIFWPPD